MMATVRGIIKEVNDEDFEITVETPTGETVKILVDELNYAPGEAIIAKGYMKNGVMNVPDMVIRLPDPEILELEAKTNEKLWNFYEPLVNEYKAQNEKELDEALAKLDDEEGGEE